MAVCNEIIGIIGAGRLGSALSRILYGKGFNVSVIVDIDNHRALQCMNECDASYSSDSVLDIENDATILFITVPDDEIEKIAGLLSKNKNLNKNAVIAHTSGLYTSDVLDSLSKISDHLCSFHPCFSFSEFFHDDLSGIYYAIEGEEKGCERLIEIVDVLEGNFLQIKKDEKCLYHLVCTLASNYLTGLIYIVQQLLNKSVSLDSMNFLWPLIEGTLSNIKTNGIEKSLTGPVIRGDVNTVKSHIDMLANFDKSILNVYSSIGQQLLKIGNELGAAPEKLKVIKEEFKKFKNDME